ncbi:MAG TPA: FtsX-like permease family protein, partial [Planctomycetota bacterium]|nr:FtsX-like permease family protein [Planctomycetota bacterium]
AGGICCIMFFFSGVILFSTFQSLILRKLKEIGILKACGASKFLIYQIFSLEAILVSTLSSLIGVGLGTLFGFKMDSWLQEYLQLPESTWFLLPTYFIVAVFLGGICFCLCVTFFPIRMAVRVDPDVVIRS